MPVDFLQIEASNRRIVNEASPTRTVLAPKGRLEKSEKARNDRPAHEAGAVLIIETHVR